MIDYISVIVTVYNSEQYIEKCIRSIMAQTFPYLEIIIVNDGSTDKTEEICKQLSITDERIILVTQLNQGAAAARKHGCQIAKGRYISIIDGDDWLEPNMYEQLYNQIQKYHAEVAMCGRYDEYVDRSVPSRHGYDAGLYTKKDLIEKIYPKMITDKNNYFAWGIFPSYWDKLFCRDNIIPYVMNVADNLPMGNDAAGVYPAMLNVKSVCIIDDCLYHYRQSDNSMVHIQRDSEEWRNGFAKLYRTVNESLGLYSNIYDCREQWLAYVLFLMVSRADSLYKNITNLEYLFPFPGVKKGSRVIIYGMGIYGKRLYKFLKQTEFCHLVMAIDQNYKSYEDGEYIVNSPDCINEDDIDAVVITISYATAIKQVRKVLEGKISKDKIYSIELENICKEKHIKALGLID